MRSRIEQLSRLSKGAVAIIGNQDLSLLRHSLNEQLDDCHLVGSNGAEMLVPGGQKIADPLDIATHQLRRSVRTFAQKFENVSVRHTSYAIQIDASKSSESLAELNIGLNRIVDNASAQIQMYCESPYWEIKSALLNNGLALAKLMDHPHFHGRKLYFFGDTNRGEPAYLVTKLASGHSIRVGKLDLSSRADFAIQTHSELKNWLGRLCDEHRIPKLVAKDTLADEIAA